VALLRLTVRRTHNVILYTVIGVTAVVGIIFFFLLTLQCQPVLYFWHRIQLKIDPTADIHGSCIDINIIIAVAYVYSVTAVCCDLALGLLPMFLVWNLQMVTQAKVALACILGMGCVYVFALAFYKFSSDFFSQCKRSRHNPHSILARLQRPRLLM
jgi:hypothetical protein